MEIFFKKAQNLSIKLYFFYYLSYNYYGDSMSKKKIDLSDIKENDLDKTSSFTDLMSRSERKKRKQKKIEDTVTPDNNDIVEMLEEKKKSTKDLTLDLEKEKKDYENKIDEEKNEQELGKTQILELTRQMKFNFEETKKENINKKKKGLSMLNIIGEINLLCIGYYIYILVFTNYQDSELNYMFTGGLIVLLVLLFGLSVITNKKISKFFNILNILAIITFIIFNFYVLI